MLRWCGPPSCFHLQFGEYSITTKASRTRLNIRRIAVLAAVLFSIAAVSAQEKTPKPRAERHFGSHLPPAAIAAMQSIRPDNIETHVRFLSHDLLEGRGTGQRGGDIAAQYIATQFALYGLKPAGDNGSYLQKVDFVGIRTVPEQTTFAFASGGNKVPLTFLDDYVVTNQTAIPTAE